VSARRWLVAALLVAVATPALGATRLDRTRKSAKEKSSSAAGSDSSDDDDGGDEACGSCLGAACELGIAAAEEAADDEPDDALPDDALPGFPPPRRESVGADGVIVAEPPPPEPPPEAPGEAWRDELEPLRDDPAANPYRVDPGPPRERADEELRVGLVAAGAYVLAERPLASFRGRGELWLGPGLGLHLGWESLHEQHAGAWDWLGLPTFGLSLQAGGEHVVGRFRLQGELLWLGDGDLLAAPGLGLEGAARFAEWGRVRAEAGVAAFPGFLSGHGAAGLGLGPDEAQLCVGWRLRWLEGLYQGPELGLAARF